MSRITIVGSGVVGTATGKGLRAHGHAVRFVDTDSVRLQQLRADLLDAHHPSDVDWTDGDVTMISVNTPTRDGEVQLSSLRAAVETLGRGLARSSAPHVVVIRSTVPPATTLRIVRPLLEETSGRRIGKNLGLAMNPEFLRAVSAETDFQKPWLTVFGTVGKREARLLHELFEPFGAPIIATDCTTAELIKYAHNLYNATKISFFNEFHLVCDQLGIDSSIVGQVVSKSAEGMWRAEYGTRGGFPYDGACLPKDTVGFLTFARQELGIEMPLLAATIKVNESMEEYVRDARVPLAVEAGDMLPHPIPVSASVEAIAGESADDAPDALSA